MSPRIPDFYEVVQFLTVYKDLKTFLRVLRNSWCIYFTNLDNNQQAGQLTEITKE